MSQLTDRSNFYVIVGSSAGALIGLQFVVLTLIAQRPRLGVAEAGAAFSTPSVVHFAVALLLSAAMTAPWHAVGAVAIFWGLVGLSGVVYSFVVARRLKIQTVYTPVFEDWLFHALLPMAAYVTLAVSALAAFIYPRTALFLIGAATLLFLFVGIHNAWDGVTWHVFNKEKERSEDKREIVQAAASPKQRTDV